MPSFAPAVFGALALAASVTASHNSFKRMSQHARVADSGGPPTWKRNDVAGVAYYGFQNGTTNACGTVSADTDMIIGVGPEFYGESGVRSSKCFQHITVSLASDPSKSIDVTLTDECSNCGGEGNVYLSTAAFEALNEGSLEAGTLDVTWSFVSSTTQAASTSTAAATTSTVKEATTSTAEEATTEAKATTSTKTSPTTTPPKASPTATSSEGWKLTEKLEGENFFNFFNFNTGPSDNSGSAEYVDGVKEGLAYISNGQVILAVDTAENVAARNSVRMVSNTVFNAKDQNLFIFDIAHMPAVCGTWPAVWFTGATWPADGEIDVVEGVSLYTQNIYSIHTGSGCTISPSAVSAMTDVTLVQQAPEGTSCDANVDPAACGVTDKSHDTFGPGFNSAGGGVFALEFDTSGIKMWFFQAGSVPSDISDMAPNPSTWGNPRMSVPPSSCSPTTFFTDLMMVVDTNLAGTFTEGLWDTAGQGGQSTSCATQTGFNTAAEYVLNQGSAFGEAAQWKINGFYIYNQ